MSEQRQHHKVESRGQQFADKMSTRIWQETASEDNPYIARQLRCHGYDLLALMEHCSYVEMFYLLFRGELPSEAQAQLLQALMVALINPGPRHDATRAAINAGVGKTEAGHLLPIGLGVLGGAEGAGALETIMRFLRKHRVDEVPQLVAEVLSTEPMRWSAVPGFAPHYGGVDVMSQAIADRLLCYPAAGDALRLGQALAQSLYPHGGGWLNTSLAAAVLSDLGFQPKAACGLYQLIAAPGILAHGLEFANKPITALPYVADADYVLETPERREPNGHHP